MATGPSLSDKKWFVKQFEDATIKYIPDYTTPVITLMGGVCRNSATIPTYGNNDAAVCHFTSDGKLMVDTELTVTSLTIDNISVFATNIANLDTAGPALIDASGHVQVDVLTMPGGLIGYAEDTAHVTGDFGFMQLAVMATTLTSLVNATGDYTPIQVNSKGSQYIDISSVLGSDISLTNPLFARLTDGVTGISVTAATNAMNTDLSSVAGTATNVNGGNRDAGTQTITLADDDPAVTALQIMDDWDETNRCAVNLISSQIGVAGGSGANGATVQRVTVATDDTVATDLTAIRTALERAPTVKNATGAAALSTLTAVADTYRLTSVSLHFSSAPTTSENVVISLDSIDGAAYDTVLYSVDPSASSATDIVYIPSGDLQFKAGDEILVAYSNTDTVTYGLRIVTQVI